MGRPAKNKQRLIEILTDAGKPLLVADLVAEMGVNKTTVYRELDDLLDVGEVVAVDFGDGRKRFELASLPHHHHVICTKCERVEGVILKQDLSKREKEIEDQTEFKILRHNLEFFGLCKDCC